MVSLPPRLAGQATPRHTHRTRTTLLLLRPLFTLRRHHQSVHGPQVPARVLPAPACRATGSIACSISLPPPALLGYLSGPAAGASLARLLRWLPSLFTVHQDQQALALCCLVCGARARAPSHSPVPGEETSRGAASVLVIALPLPLSLSHVTRTPLSLSRFGFVPHLIMGRTFCFSHGLFAGFELDGTDNAAVLDASRPLVMQSSARAHSVAVPEAMLACCH